MAGRLGIDQSTKTHDELFLDEFPVLTEPFTLLSGQDLKRGRSVGVQTSGGKIIGQLTTSSDGSETSIGFLAEDADASSGDVKVAVFVSGSFDQNFLEGVTGNSVAIIAQAKIDLAKSSVFVNRLGQVAT